MTFRIPFYQPHRTIESIRNTTSTVMTRTRVGTLYTFSLPLMLIFLSPRMPNTIPQLPNLHCKRPFLLIQTMVKKEERVSQTRPGGKNKKHRSNPSTSHHQVRPSTQHHIHNFVNFVRSSPPTRLPLALLTIRSRVNCMRGYC